ncbi:hypothetical protein DL93DRAFT_2228159 [Clavulina sp. PMI_390]|nr:hypothetical protein DL93DRAFT_2228159 [Clavulina sp. PMI_390]
MAAQARASPLISELYLDVPTQRLLVISVLGATQAMKIMAFVASLADSDGTMPYQLLLKWCLIDAFSLWLIPLLRIPRLSFDSRARTAQIILFCTFNWVLFGNYTFSLGRFLPFPVRSLLSLFEYDQIAISQRRVKIQDVVDYGSHLLGQHTVRLSPIRFDISVILGISPRRADRWPLKYSKARLNPENLPFCIASPTAGVFIPILLNNTKTLSFVSYSVSALGDQGPKAVVNVTSRELKKMQTSALNMIADQLQNHGPTSPFETITEEEDDIWGSDAGSKKVATRKDAQSQLILPSTTSFRRSQLNLEKTQHLVYIKVTRPGLLHLERALDPSGAEIKLPRRPGEAFEATVVECPTTEWGDDARPGKVCVNAGTKDVSINVRGTAPMTLKWHHKDRSAKVDSFVVEGIKGSTEADSFAVAQDVRIPLTLRLDTPGMHTYALDSLTDGSGNTLDLVQKFKDFKGEKPNVRVFDVLGQSSISFLGCGKGQDTVARLLHGKQVELAVMLNEHRDVQDGPWVATVRYDPPAGLIESGGKASKSLVQGWTKEYTIPSDKRAVSFNASKPGEYTILKVSGQLCPGEVLSPETCRVVEQPKPAAEIEFKSIHECASDTGVTAIATLHGSPPFKLHYTAEYDGRVTSFTKDVQGHRASIELKPSSRGKYTYTFSHVSDAYYKKEVIAGSPTTTREVRPLAEASFRSRGEASVSNCEGSEVEFELNLTGAPPFNVEVQLIGPSGSDLKTFTGLRDHHPKIKIPILKDLDRTGGVMEVDLVSVEDSTGCKRALSVSRAVVNVHRVKPTVKFYYPEGNQDVLKLQGETAILPLRLTGDGPWSITYGRNESSNVRVGRPLVKRINSANEKIEAMQQGVYELLSVSDKHCPGVVVPEAAIYDVKNVQKPIGVFSANAGEMTTSGAILRPPVCVGVSDYADIDLEGRAPFQVRYRYNAQLRGRERVEDHETFNSIQKTSRLQLRTAEPGFHEYHLVDVGDTAYPLPARTSQGFRHSGTLLQQEVLSRPTVHFKTARSSPYCLHQNLVPRPGHNDDPVVVLNGKAPFRLSLSIKNLATSETTTAVVDVLTSEWKVDVPTHKLQTVGPHLITIDSFEDSSPCSPDVVDFDRRSFKIDVAETAAIVPFDRRTDWCLGDTADFQLQGSAPWKIEYRINSTKYDETVRKPKYSRALDKVGIMEVTGVSHQQASCKSEVSDVRLDIHPIPSARVSHGDNVIEDLREGDQAEIVFSLIGTPPFTFTYQRASLPTSKAAPEVMETHTVSGVMAHEYSIFSALEGKSTRPFPSIIFSLLVQLPDVMERWRATNPSPSGLNMIDRPTNRTYYPFLTQAHGPSHMCPMHSVATLAEPKAEPRSAGNDLPQKHLIPQPPRSFQYVSSPHHPPALRRQHRYQPTHSIR